MHNRRTAYPGAPYLSFINCIVNSIALQTRRFQPGFVFWGISAKSRVVVKLCKSLVIQQVGSLLKKSLDLKGRFL
jgi:hypothetical protein